jgi:hypothetical protein
MARKRSFFMGKEALAFKVEPYRGEMPSIDRVIYNDFLSYLGEYRFKLLEFDYRQGLNKGKLTDPETGEPWQIKGRKAILQKQKDGLPISREVADLAGITSLEEKLLENPLGTIVWFSPRGPEEQGYGDYGFANIGKRDKDGIAFTAIRLNGSTIDQFNQVRNSLGIGGSNFRQAEEFIACPWIVNKSVEDVKDVIRRQFGVRDNGAGSKFERAKIVFADHIKDFIEFVKHGTQGQIQKARNTIENLIIEYIKRGEEKNQENVVFMSDFRTPVLAAAMEMTQYLKEPEPVKGSCGSSSTKKKQSNNVFTNLGGDSSSSGKDKEWFTCPKCHYKADRPVGDTCPGCGLTKEQFAESGALMCE